MLTPENTDETWLKKQQVRFEKTLFEQGIVTQQSELDEIAKKCIGQGSRKLSHFEDFEPEAMSFVTMVLDSIKETFAFCKMCDSQGRLRFTYANDSLVSAFGIGKHEIIGITDEDLGLPRDEVARVTELDLKLLSDTGSDRAFITEQITPTRDRRTRLFQTCKKALVLPDGSRQLFGLAVGRLL